MLIANRENLYRFIGRIFKIEADQKMLDQMVAMSFPIECGDDELGEGYRMLEGYLRRLKMDTLTDLAVDYAKIFLGAGTSESNAAYPYESVYTSPKRLIMQDARDRVVAAYRAKGLDKAETLDFPEDHIALELEFMAYLCHQTQDAIAAQDRLAISGSIKEQEVFLAQHLLNWVPTLCADIQKFADTDFYTAVAKITNGYLRMEQVLLEGLTTEPGMTA